MPTMPELWLGRWRTARRCGCLLSVMFWLRAHTGRQADTRAHTQTQVVTLRNHILVAGFPVSIRSFMMAVSGLHTGPLTALPTYLLCMRRVSTDACGPQVRNSEAVAHALRDTKGPPSQPHSAASGAPPSAWMCRANAA